VTCFLSEERFVNDDPVYKMDDSSIVKQCYVFRCLNLQNERYWVSHVKNIISLMWSNYIWLDQTVQNTKAFA
jgi:hypothetical protein